MSNIYNNFSNLNYDTRLDRSYKELITARENFEGCGGIQCYADIKTYNTELPKNKTMYNGYKSITSENMIGNLFFHSTNIKNIQISIRRNVYEISKGSYNISEQSIDCILIIMRSIYTDHAFEDFEHRNLTEHIRYLNKKVISVCVHNILVNIEAFNAYNETLKDYAKHEASINPINVNTAGTRNLFNNQNF